MIKLIKNIGVKMVKGFLTIGNYVLSIADPHYLNPLVPEPENVAFGKWLDYLGENFNKEGMKILEIGSREVNGLTRAPEVFSLAEYTGFDYKPGNNVDIVGDIHKLSSYFDEDQKFDLIYSKACFEHFSMPWQASIEMAKMLKVGGFVFVETHFSFSAHGRPWNFFQFSDLGLEILFSETMGIQKIEAGMSSPMVGRFSRLAHKSKRYGRMKGLYAHSEFLGRKIKHVPNFSWSIVTNEELTKTTQYPH